MSFLDNLLGGIKRIMVGGTLLPPELNLNFQSGFTVVDNPSNGRIDVSSAVSNASIESSVGVSHQVQATSGIVVVAFSSLAGSVALTLPDAITVGTTVLAGVTDGSLSDVNTIVWTPASGNISYAGVSAGVFTQKNSDFPKNSFVRFVKLTGSLWLSI